MDMQKTLPALASIAMLVTATAAPAQDLDPTRGLEAVGVTATGRVVVLNGEATFDCALEADGATARLADCRAHVAPASLQALSDADWQAAVRDTLLDARCRVSAFGAVADVIAAAAEANGVPPAGIERVRTELSERAEAAVRQMLRDGALTYRDGELALDRCP
jgi:hypothetical protein